MGQVLVVDDEIDICILLSDQLKKLGFQTSYCHSIKDAHVKLADTTYELAFVDLNLPDGSGYDLIHSLRAIDKKVKIVVISAYEASRQKVLEVGANLYVAKPFNSKSIREALKELDFLNNIV